VDARWQGDRVQRHLTRDWERAPVDSDVHRVALADAIRTLTDRDGPDHRRWSRPIGKPIAYLGFDDSPCGYQNSRLYVMDIDGATARADRNLDRSVEATGMGERRHSVYVDYEDHGSVRVARVGLDGSVRTAAEGLTGQRGSPYAGGEYSVARDGTLASPAALRCGLPTSPWCAVARRAS
jgi:hypothetical protein